MLKAKVLELLQNPDFALSNNVDLTNCDREAIHQLNTVQPHGFLIAYSHEGKVLQVSSNIIGFLGLSPDHALGLSLAELLGTNEALQVRSHEKSDVYQKHFRITLDTDGSTQIFNSVLHLNEGFWVVEFEPRLENSKEFSLSDFSLLLQKQRTTESLESLWKLASKQMQDLLLFDRVMVYKFAEDGSGQVVGESVREGFEPFMGLRYPATDIPQQARLMYLHSDYRSIANINAVPATVVPTINPLTASPLNFGNAVLRSVSPIHIEYLQNMGVQASMSISIIVDGKLWGLFACHHYSAHNVAFPDRDAAALLAKNFSGLLQDRIKHKEESYLLHIRKVQTSLFERFNYEDDFVGSLHSDAPTIKDIVNCTGCAILSEGQFVALGTVPSRQQCEEIINWLQNNRHAGDIYATDQLGLEFEPAQEYAKQGSGLLAIAISKIQGEYILWFRPEKIETVTWAGKPEAKILASTEPARLSPRKSFVAWQQEVRFKSETWSQLEISAVSEMRNILVDIVMRIAGELKLRADILSRVNKELEASNNELDSFAYIASHDLKEPLRGIQNYSQFLLEDYQHLLEEDGKQKLHTLMRLSRRMSSLLDSLLQYSQVGRVELYREMVDLNEIVTEVKEDLRASINAHHQVIIENKLPIVNGDHIRIGEIFQNLITNGFKYNDSKVKQILIGLKGVEEINSTKQATIYVKDNGIGIDKNNFDSIFTIFRRLHSRNAYGGGTGIGLTIVKKVIERHGGTLWLESNPAQGTTFYFTLPLN